MKVYLAGQGGFPWKKQNYYDFYRLDSYFDVKNKKTNHYKFKDFILDSGVFTYLTSKKDKKVDWDKYVYEYGSYVKKEGIENYVEVDVDVKIGLKEVERLRKNLEKIVGYKSIPVWHLNRSYDKWLEICKDYDYICFGAFLTDGLKEEKFPYIKKFLSDAKKNKCRVHGLGMTSMKWLKQLPFYSVDSSSWTSGCRFGSYHKFNGRQIKSISKPKSKRIIDTYKLGEHNFNEWIKFQKYADEYL